MFQGKSGLILGVANDKSIATGIAQVLAAEGASLGFNFLPDDRGKMEQRVKKAVDSLQPKLIAPCNVNDDASVRDFFAQVKETMGTIDFLVHSIAFAPLDDIRCSVSQVSRAGFLNAMETSVFSFMHTAKYAAELMPEGGSMLTLSYYGGEKVLPGYNLMGIAKAALESSVGYLAFDLGTKKIRVNAISAGPIKTLAASAIGDFGDMLSLNQAMSPMDCNVTAEDVGKTAAYLLSDYSQRVTGEVLHVDAGYHIMGSPAHVFKRWGIRPRELMKQEDK